MIIILIENDLYSLQNNLFLKSLEQKFPRTSTLFLTNRSLNEVIDTINTSKPLLTSKWLVLGNNVKENAVLSIVKHIADNVLVLKYQSRTNAVNDLMKLLKSMSIDFKVVDNFNLSNEKIVSYVSEQLGLSETDSKTLVKRCNGYLPYVNESVFALKSLNRKVERKDVLDFVVNRSTFNTLSLFNHIIGYKKVNNEVVGRFLYDFKYATKYLKKDLLEKFDDALLVYSLMNEGLLTPENFREFEFPKKLKISDYLLKSLVVDVYKEVSYETLLYNKLVISKISNTFQLLEICTV